MPSATPIYDALAEELFGPLTDFVPQWLIVHHAECGRPPCRTRTRCVLPPSEAHPLDHPRDASPLPPRHRLS